MTAGLINIVSYGANELYLTGAPQMTFFKIIYRRHTNFSKESISVPLNNFNFGDTIDVEIPKTGDLMDKMYLQINIPQTYFLRSDLGITPTNNYDPIAKNNYNIVLQYMKINAATYRVAYEDSATSNLTATNMINDMLTELASFPTTQTTTQQYRDILATAYAENNFSYLYPDATDILKIVADMNTDITNDPTSWTTTKIMQSITNEIQLSIQVQQFFFTQWINYEATYKSESSSYAYFAWVEKLGHSMIDYIDINIGGEKIDRHYGQWLDIWHELTGNKTQTQLYNKLIGNVSELTTFNQDIKPSYLVTVPLQFWFCRNTGLAFPLIALRYNTVTLTIKFKKLEDCAYIEKNPDQTDDLATSLTNIWTDNGYNLTGNMRVDYIFLDSLERKRFAQSAHEYLIERVQYMSLPDNNITNVTVNLDFRSPCKEIIWVAQKTAYVNNTTGYYRSLWGNYSTTGTGNGNSLLYGSLSFNGYDRIKKTAGSYFNYVQPYTAHNNSVIDGINMYSFSIYPEEHQPSCTCNFSRISEATLYLFFDPDMLTYQYYDIDPSIPIPEPENPSPYPAVWRYGRSDEIPTELPTTTFNISIYTISYNIFRLIGGMGALAYY